MLAFSSRKTTLVVDDCRIETQKYDLDLARRFEPTIIVDCAFVTRDKVKQFGLNSFLETNRYLISAAKNMASMETVRKFIAISSGAAKPYLNRAIKSFSEDPYGELKAEYEILLAQEEREIAQKVVISRPFSLSGRFVRNRSIYAIFDFIDQAKKANSIVLNSKTLVYRRYSDAEEFLALSLALEPGGEALESGGELIELGELAKLVAEQLNLTCSIERYTIQEPPDMYFSNESSMGLACKELNFRPSTLGEQILLSANHTATEC